MIRLDVPYNEKDSAKQLGARWDGKKRCWYVPEGMLITPFEKWLPIFASSEPENAPKPAAKPTKNKSGKSDAKVQPESRENIGFKFFKIDHNCIPWERCEICSKDSRLIEWAQ